MTTPAIELSRHFDGLFRVLILDNEVTVDAFVTDPPLPWARLTASEGVYRIGEGYTYVLRRHPALQERDLGLPGTLMSRGHAPHPGAWRRRSARPCRG